MTTSLQFSIIFGKLLFVANMEREILIMNKKRCIQGTVICRVLAWILIICSIASAAFAENYHTFCDLPFSMPLGEYKQWLATNTANAREPLYDPGVEYTSYGDFGELHISMFDMTGQIVQAVFKNDVGLSSILVCINDASYHPLRAESGESASDGIARAVDAYFRIVDAFVSAYGPWDDSYCFLKEGVRSGSESKNLPYPIDRESLRMTLEACDGTTVKLRFDNVFLFYTTAATEYGSQESCPNTLASIVYWGPDMPETCDEVWLAYVQQ